jgi:hypothetical protein
MTQAHPQVTQIVSLFNTTELGEKEELAARIFTTAQLAVLNNDRIKIAQELMNLTYKGSKDEEYALRLAELQGQLLNLSFLIDCSYRANEELNNPLTNQE